MSKSVQSEDIRSIQKTFVNKYSRFKREPEAVKDLEIKSRCNSNSDISRVCKRLSKKTSGASLYIGVNKNLNDGHFSRQPSLHGMKSSRSPNLRKIIEQIKFVLKDMKKLIENYKIEFERMADNMVEKMKRKITEFLEEKLRSCNQVPSSSKTNHSNWEFLPTDSIDIEQNDHANSTGASSGFDALKKLKGEMKKSADAPTWTALAHEVRMQRIEVRHFGELSNSSVRANNQETRNKK